MNWFWLIAPFGIAAALMAAHWLRRRRMRTPTPLDGAGGEV